MLSGMPDIAVWALLLALTLASLWRESPLQYVLTVIAITYGIAALASLILKEPNWWLPLAVLNSRCVSRLILSKWRAAPYYGWWLMAFTCVLSAILLPHWISVLFALAMQLATLPWLIKRRPGRDAPSYFPLINWLLFAAWIVIRKF